MYPALRNPLIEKNSSFKADLTYSLEDRVSYSLLHHKELPSAISLVDLPARYDNEVFFIYLNEDRLYSEVNGTLYVSSVSELSSPIATYTLGGGWWCGGV